jgi:PadR family transcriptional regulator AphA
MKGYVPAVARARPDLSLNDWTVLGVVAEAPTHGWAVVRALAPGSTIGQAWTVSRPLVYRSLSTLTTLGFVEEQGNAPSERGPQRVLLRATPRGRGALRNWLATPVDHIRELRSEFLVKVALLDRAGRSPRDLARRQLDHLAPVLSAYADEPDGDGFDRVLWQWRRASVDAAARFLHELAGERRGVRRSRDRS